MLQGFSSPTDLDQDCEIIVTNGECMRSVPNNNNRPDSRVSLPPDGRKTIHLVRSLFETRHNPDRLMVFLPQHLGGSSPM